MPNLTQIHVVIATGDVNKRTETYISAHVAGSCVAIPDVDPALVNPELHEGVAEI